MECREASSDPKLSMMCSQPRVPMGMVKPGQQSPSVSIGPGSVANATANGGSGERGTGGPASGISSTRPGSVQAVPLPPFCRLLRLNSPYVI